MKEESKIRKIAFVGDHLPRKCGIATFTSDLLSAVADAYPQSQCLSVSVNDIKGGYEYPEVVRFEIEEQDLPSYLRAADFLNISNADIVCLVKIFPRIVEHRAPDEPVRIRAADCSTGEEAYSIAMAFSEFASERAEHIPVQIFATDINEKGIESARAGLYS